MYYSGHAGAGTGAVDRRNGHLGHLVQQPGQVERLGAQRLVDAALGVVLEVGAGAERLADAAHDDDPHVGVHRGSPQRLEVGVLEVETPAVVAVRAVPLQEQDTLLEGSKDEVVAGAAAHARHLPTSTPTPPQARSDDGIPGGGPGMSA